MKKKENTYKDCVPRDVSWMYFNRRLMKAYRQMMKIYDVVDYRACATSAMRDAVNGSEVIDRIFKDTGINIEIIDGKEEAHIVYSNHVECMADRIVKAEYIHVTACGAAFVLGCSIIVVHLQRDAH